MLSWSKRLYVVVGSVVLFGCVSSGGSGGATETSEMNQSAAKTQSSGMKMVAANCMNELNSERQQCEQKCPTATGNEHFSMQHKIAMENAECKERCATTLEERAAQCKAAR